MARRSGSGPTSIPRRRSRPRASTAAGWSLEVLGLPAGSDQHLPPFAGNANRPVSLLGRLDPDRVLVLGGPDEDRVVGGVLAGEAPDPCGLLGCEKDHRKPLLIIDKTALARHVR